MKEFLLSSEVWSRAYEPYFIILDPDGWDRTPQGWEKSWSEKISRTEFLKRMCVSTCIFKVNPYRIPY